MYFSFSAIWACPISFAEYDDWNWASPKNEYSKQHKIYSQFCQVIAANLLDVLAESLVTAEQLRSRWRWVYIEQAKQNDEDDGQNCQKCCRHFDNLILISHTLHKHTLLGFVNKNKSESSSSWENFPNFPSIFLCENRLFLACALSTSYSWQRNYWTDRETLGAQEFRISQFVYCFSMDVTSDKILKFSLKLRNVNWKLKDLTVKQWNLSWKLTLLTAIASVFIKFTSKSIRTWLTGIWRSSKLA